MVRTPKTWYGDRIKALKRAFVLCKQGECESALPLISMSIKWMQENNFEFPTTTK